MQGNSREEKPRRETAPFSRTVCHLKAQPGARLTPAEAHGRARAQSRASRALGGAEPRASVNSANHVSLPPPPPPLGPASPRHQARLGAARAQSRHSGTRGKAKLRASVGLANRASLWPPAWSRLRDALARAAAAPACLAAWGWRREVGSRAPSGSLFRS